MVRPFPTSLLNEILKTKLHHGVSLTSQELHKGFRNGHKIHDKNPTSSFHMG